jgi:hypothetical protein
MISFKVQKQGSRDERAYCYLSTLPTAVVGRKSQGHILLLSINLLGSDSRHDRKHRLAQCRMKHVDSFSVVFSVRGTFTSIRWSSTDQDLQ